MKSKILLVFLFSFLIPVLNYAQDPIKTPQHFNEIKILNEPVNWPEEYADFTRNHPHFDLFELESTLLPADFSIDSNLAQQLQNVLEEAVMSDDIKGLSAALSAKNGDIWTGAAGISHDTVEMDPDMLLGMGSITKNFIATIILQLYEEGTLSIYDSLHAWLPTFENIDTTVTIIQLLNHTSGIYNYTNHPNLADSIITTGSRIWTPEELLNYFVLTPSFSPGAEWGYSNTNYILLGMIIEEATGNEVVDELNTRIFDLLNLDATWLFPDEGYEGFRSHVWLPDGDSLFDATEYADTTFFSAVWTAGAMLSTSEDLVKWSKALYEGGVLNDSTLELMKAAAPHSNGFYGLGTQIGRVLLQRIYGHTGDVWYFSQLFYKPNDSLSIVVMSNTRFAPVNTIWLNLYYTYKDVLTSTQPPLENSRLTVYPNPTSSRTRFAFSLDEKQFISLAIYNQLGQKVEVISDGSLSKGDHILNWASKNYAPGIYFYRLNTKTSTISGQIIVNR